MQTQRELVHLHPSKGILNIDVLSFGRLAHRVFEEVGTDRRTVLTETGKNLMLRKVAIEQKGKSAGAWKQDGPPGLCLRSEVCSLGADAV